MILYSIVPVEVVFDSYNAENYTSKPVEMEYLGQIVEVSHVSSTECIINRVISTSPEAYLNPKLQPGNVIRSSF